MPELPSTSVVIPTYNGAHLLERILPPLLADPAANEVIVVVDGSRDGSFELVERLARDEPRLRPLFIENSGDMGAREAGARAAGSEIVLFLDDDGVADPGLVTRHAQRHAERTADVMIGYMPVRRTAHGAPDEFALRLYADEYEGGCHVYDRDQGNALRHLWGGNFSMRRADCLAIGMSNPDFTEHYHADREFGIRCLKAGLIGTFDRALSAVHLHERTLESFVRDARSQGRARVLLARFHPEIVATPDPGEFAARLPRPIHDLVRLTRRHRAYTVVSASLELLLRAPGVDRLALLQEYLARVLRRIEQQHGAIEQSHRRDP